MGFKKYIIASFVFLMIVAAYVYNIDDSEFTVKIVELGINKTLPIYIWIIMPALFLFFATIIHMIFYGTKGYLQRTTLKRDISKLSILLNDRLLDKTSSISIKTPSLKNIADVLNSVEMKITKDSESSPLIASSLKTIHDIESGKYIPAKELKLPSNNIWAIKNTKNRLLNDSNFAVEVIKDADNYTTDLVEMAFDIALENKPVESIKRLTQDVTLTKNMIQKLLIKDSEQLSLTNNEILGYIGTHSFTNKELIAIAKNYKKTMAPEQLLHLFEDLCSKNEEFTSSYLYILFEYQMITKVRETLINSQKDEYVLFKALLDLKDSGKYNYSIDDFILE
jgi:hypothetical protein